MRAPPSDAVQRARDAADALSELEHRRDADHRDLQELRDLLCRPHFKVSYRGYLWYISFYEGRTNSVLNGAFIVSFVPGKCWLRGERYGYLGGRASGTNKARVCFCSVIREL